MSEIKNHSKAYWTCQILGWGIYGLLNTVFLSAFQTITAQNLGITVFGSVQLLLWTHLLRTIFKKRHWVTLPLWKLFDIAPETRQVEIPPMTIQTLVENAIRHGIALHPDGGEISIRTTLSACDNAQTGNQQPVMVVCIVNTGQMKNNTTNDGIGLQNSRERLHLLFGNTAQLTVENISQNQVCAKFQVPFTGQQI